MKKKILIYILIGILLYAAILTIEISVVCAITGKAAPTYLKETLEWYCKLIKR